jgi:hypothetical protein
MASALLCTQRCNVFPLTPAYSISTQDCLVPKKYEEDPKLASWIENQRVLYNRDYKSHEPRSSLFKQDSSYSGVAYSTPSEGKSPEEWGLEMDKGTPATEEDAAEVAATMAEATMEVVNDVVAPIDDATMDEMGGVEDPNSDTDVAMDSPNGDGTEPMSENMLQQVRRLSQERKEKLDALGFVWSLRSKRVDDHWDLSKCIKSFMQFLSQVADSTSFASFSKCSINSKSTRSSMETAWYPLVMKRISSWVSGSRLKGTSILSSRERPPPLEKAMNQSQVPILA